MNCSLLEIRGFLAQNSDATKLLIDSIKLEYIVMWRIPK